MTVRDEVRQTAAEGRELRVVHTSDVHVDNDFFATQYGGDGTGPLRAVIDAAERLAADVLLLVGDTFDHNRLPSHVIERAAFELAGFSGRVIALPGNHDPATPDCPFRSKPFLALERVVALGVHCGSTVQLPEFDLEVWGRPHLDYGDMDPFAGIPPRRTGRRIVLGHGHYEPVAAALGRLRPGWLFDDAALSSIDADYVALGHWNRAVRVGADVRPAWYCGSPDVARSVNLVHFRATDLRVTREAIPSPSDYSASG